MSYIRDRFIIRHTGRMTIQLISQICHIWLLSNRFKTAGSKCRLQTRVLSQRGTFGLVAVAAEISTMQPRRIWQK